MEQFNIEVLNDDSFRVTFSDQGIVIESGTWHTGTGAPEPGLGLDGDFYYDTNALSYYGPKVAGAWGAVKVLTGTEGPAGPAGPQGAQGIAGDKGERGSMWYSGANLPTGGLGVDGDFYLHTTTGVYYWKQSGSWNEQISLKGADGVQGIDGPTGQQGVQGEQGPQGIQGLPGADGANGVDGVDGNTIHSGGSAPTAGIGQDGDIYIHTINHTYQLKAAGVWGSPVSIVGPQGATGATGATGAQGPQGIQGVQGPAGTDGADGLGVPVGGTTGQVLAKVDNTDHNTTWVDPAAGGGTGLAHTAIGDGAYVSQSAGDKLVGIQFITNFPFVENDLYPAGNWGSQFENWADAQGPLQGTLGALRLFEEDFESGFEAISSADWQRVEIPIAVTIGQTYVVSFDYKSTVVADANDRPGVRAWQGVSATPDDMGYAQGEDWVRKSYTVTASATEMTVRWYPGTSGTFGNGMAIKNVTIVQQ